MMDKISAAAVAEIVNEFISLAEKDSSFLPLTPMKLQALLFYAQEWFTTNKDYPLFDENIQAWPFGSAVRSVQLHIEKNKNRALERRIMDISTGGENEMLRYSVPLGVEDESTRDFIHEF